MNSPWSHVSIDFPASATSILGAEAGSAWGGPKNPSVGLYEELISYKDYEIRDIYEYENINVLYIYSVYIYMYISWPD